MRISLRKGDLEQAVIDGFELIRGAARCLQHLFPRRVLKPGILQKEPQSRHTGARHVCEQRCERADVLIATTDVSVALMGDEIKDRGQSERNREHEPLAGCGYINLSSFLERCAVINSGARDLIHVLFQIGHVVEGLPTIGASFDYRRDVLLDRPSEVFQEFHVFLREEMLQVRQR